MTKEVKNPKIICVASNKGGVGKTATVAALGYLLNKKHKVLLIDTDPQGNLSSKFEFYPSDRYPNYIGALISDRINSDEHKAIANYINHNNDYPNLDIIVSDQRLDAVFTMLATIPFKNTGIFKEIINEIKALNKYDYIIYDTRPSLSNEVGAALVSSEWVLIPVLSSYDSIMGANAVFEFMGSCRSQNPNLKTAGVFFNMNVDKTKAYHDIKPFVQDSWSEYLLSTVIPRNQSVVNAENVDCPVTKKYPASKASKAFTKLLKEVLSKIEKQEN